MGCVIIPKPNVSSREGILSRCRRLYLLFIAVVAQSVAAMITVVAVQVVAVPTGCWPQLPPSLVHLTEHSRGDLVFSVVFRLWKIARLN